MLLVHAPPRMGVAHRAVPHYGMQGPAAGVMAYWNGTEWLSIAPGQNGQTLTFCNGVPTWGGCPTGPNNNRRTRR